MTLPPTHSASPITPTGAIPDPATSDNSAQPATIVSPRSSILLRAINLIAVVFPFLGFLATILLLWGWGIDLIHLSVFTVMYFLTGLGITVGFHRLFTHRAFEAVRPLKVALAVIGSMAVEGPLMRWVANHRRHHQHSDTENDIHSPH